MKKSLKTAWIAALRSGDFAQATGTLQRVADEARSGGGVYQAGNCCLGVLCVISDIPSRQHPRLPKRLEFILPFTQPAEGLKFVVDGLFPDWYLLKIGLYLNDFDPATSTPDAVSQGQMALINMNDSGASFEDIALWIQIHIAEEDDD